MIQFRSIHAWSYVSASLMFLLAAVTGFLPLMFIASALTGLGNAGGVLAWNLGHQDFAPPGRDSQYMGVHVTLTGIRGLMAPFLAVGIYQLLDSGSPGAGIWVFIVCLVLNVVGAVGFWRMAADLRKERNSDLCQQCGYDLRGTRAADIEKCPECGIAIRSILA